jgi:hypothetical protein
MTSSEVDRPAHADEPGREEPRDGDVIRFGRRVFSGVNRGQPLVMEFEARIVTGHGGETIARGQAAAIREVLAWIASRQQSRDDESRDDTRDG